MFWKKGQKILKPCQHSYGAKIGLIQVSKTMIMHAIIPTDRKTASLMESQADFSFVRYDFCPACGKELKHKLKEGNNALQNKGDTVSSLCKWKTVNTERE